MEPDERKHMARVVAIGEQDFETIVGEDSFYVDKTKFIKEWWENRDSVTLITRPRRFGKTLMMNMVERFFSVKYKGQGGLFDGLNIWKDEKYQKLQGTYPVINLSFASTKGDTYHEMHKLICRLIYEQYDQYRFLLNVDGLMSDSDKELFYAVSRNMEDDIAVESLKALSKWLMKYYGKKVIILLDEYDTPMQEAYVYGYWDALAFFIRNLFNSTFKANPYLKRAIMTGITRISKESIFSDLNNLVVVTSTSNKYADSFGFTQEEVSDALQEFGLQNEQDDVKDWYDGFTFGDRTDLYNPWSITNFLDTARLATYWVNTSSNRLVNELVRKGRKEVKIAMEDLLKEKVLHAKIDEQIVFSQLGDTQNAIWSLLLASGYLKVAHYQTDKETGKVEYALKLTNKEVKIMFQNMIEGWFTENPMYNHFIKAMLEGDLSEMNDYMNKVALTTISYFDTGEKPSETTQPERFYHGFVLGMMVDLSDRYEVTSNRESGFGRYDVMMKPRKLKGEGLAAIILEFKVYDSRKETSLKETTEAALMQIRDKRYASSLMAEGIPEERIREYGFAFEGKTVLIDGGSIRQVNEMLEELAPLKD